jgi:DNA-binding XRE family transcriptional regulator
LDAGAPAGTDHRRGPRSSGVELPSTVTPFTEHAARRRGAPPGAAEVRRTGQLAGKWQSPGVRRRGSMSFGRHLRGWREGAGLSRSELARKAGIPVSTLRNWEGDRGFPGLSACLRLAEALGMRVERFAAGVVDPHEEEPPPEKSRRRRKGKNP